jgi:nitrogen fixation/metabolism regulation signal transduction histidine kinase
LQRGLSVIENRAESLNRFVQAYRQLAQLPAPVLKRVPLVPLLERVISLEIRLEVRLLAAPDVDLLADADQIEQLLINLVRNAVESALTCVEEEPEAAGAPAQTEIVIPSAAERSAFPPPSRSPEPGAPAGTATEQTETDIPVRKRSGVSTAEPCTPSVTIRALEEGDLVAIVIEDNGPGLANPDNLFVPLYTTKKSGSGVGLALARQIVEAHGGAIELRNRPNHQGCTAEVRLPVAERSRG